jgi:hypothetical protein
MSMPPVKQPGVTREEIMQALARGYVAPRNAQKEMDIDLIVAMADEVQKLIEDEYGSILPTEGN